MSWPKVVRTKFIKTKVVGIKVVSPKSCRGKNGY
jgi:hypothetical protein